MKSKTMRIALVGEMSAGPIVPLLAVADHMKEKGITADFTIMDVAGSVGEHMAKRDKIPFIRMHSGRFRHYWTVRNIAAPFLLIVGFFQALYYLRRHKITRVLGAGGFVQVPVVWAAWLLRIPRHIHQEDVEPTRSNIWCAPVATSISVTFEPSLRDFRQGLGLFGQEARKNISLTGNPCRNLAANKQEAQNFFHLDKTWPTLFVTGGGTGALAINKFIWQALPELTRTVQIIHSTGRGKNKPVQQERYHAFEFIDRADLAYAASDMVLCRAGISNITELSHLGKVAMIIPMPNTHQESNAALLYEKQAALVFDQNDMTPAGLVRVVRKLLFSLPVQEGIARNIKTIMPHNAAEKITKLIIDAGN